MLPLYTASVLASGAQRRVYDGVRLDGRVVGKPSLWRTVFAALFARPRASAPRPTGRTRLAAA
jgi:hypothetical protein